jgi:hypothetical protein
MKVYPFPAVICSAMVVAVLASPLLGAVINCATGNLATVDNTTCDIGNLQFTFDGLVGFKPGIIPWTDSDFTFTVLSNGFELSGPPAQTLSGSGSPVNDYAELEFSVTDLTDTITGLDVSGGNLSASGPDSYAEYNLYVAGAAVPDQFEQASSFFVSNFSSGLDSHNASGPSIVSGSGYAEPFELVVIEGGTASIDSTATNFTFTTGPLTEPVPEPRLSTLLGIGVLGLLAAAICKGRQ